MTNSNEIKQLSVCFQSARSHLTAVDKISFTLVPGETVALLGESGCGKSLTALALMRLLPHYAVYGQKSQINIDNQDILELPEKVMRQLRGKKLAIIFQEPMTALNPVKKIGDQLAEAVNQNRQLTGKTLHEKLVRLLQEVEISEPELRLNQYPHQLSGGQKQRIVIAMALANNPDILIADEPTTALDVTIQAQILALLKKLQAQYRMSMLLITHDLGVVKTAADRVCVMYAGQLVEVAEAKVFFNEVKHPYSQRLLASIPDIAKRSNYLQTITGSVPVLSALPSGCRFHPRCAHRFELCTDIMPVMQTIDGRSVRCHLYPEHHKLPAIDEISKQWPERPENSEILFTVDNLSVYFEIGKRLLRKGQTIKAVDGLSFELAKGRTLALVGESGCGKTTASRALLRLITATSGQIHYRGENVLQLSGRSLKEYRKKVQIIFQDPYSSLNPRMSIGEIIAEGMIAQGVSSSQIQRRQALLLDQVNLPKNCLSRYPHQFSGGQRQRISIARALATEPEVLICDEPTSALDVSVQAQILNLLKELQYETAISYLFITHNMAVVSYLADDVLVMRHGKAVESGSCRQILTTPEHAYTKRLLASVLTVN
ncbi:dipeptide ABC transporter ATP-binding protein [Legionella dresdenensis]|uniref:ABC-type dipeptide transporter n=1 Tax=Legionella dresdenensis TaxID=450200 RepID=A0ABV8CHZ5_9GAMM